MICCMAPGCKGPGWCLPGQTCNDFDCCALGSSCNTCPHGSEPNNDECAGKGNMMCLGPNGSGDPHPLSTDEAYLKPYLSELLDYRDNPIARRYIFLSDLVNILPTGLIDFVLKIILHGDSVKIPINKVFPVTLPIIKTQIASLTLESIDLKGLTTLANLWAPYLMSSGKFTWAASLDMKEIGATLNTKIKFLGKETEVAVDVDLSELHFDIETIIAFNRTRLCEVYSGALSLVTSHCGAWALGVDLDNQMSGLNITKFHVGAQNMTFNVLGKGVIIDALKKLLEHHDATAQIKQWFLEHLSTDISKFVRDAIDVAGLMKLASMADETDCLPPTATISNQTLNASRICISNNAAFAENFATANCRLPEGRGVSSQSGAYPIDQSRCMDVEQALPGTKEGDIIRTVSHAIAGIYEILDPPLRYAPNSNSASFECSGSTVKYGCPFVSIAPVDKSKGAPASKICVINHAGFVMSFEVQKGGHSIDATRNYPIEHTQCIDLGGKASRGDAITTVVHACGGRVNVADQHVEYIENQLVATYECTGTTMNYQCKMLGSYDQTAFETAFGSRALAVEDPTVRTPQVLCDAGGDSMEIVV